jgi:hypothetical protein
MTEPARHPAETVRSIGDFDLHSRGRLLARLSVVAALLSCACNCVFSQLASRIGSSLGQFGGIVDWSSLAIVLAGLGCGVAAIAAGVRRKSPDTTMIAAIGVILNGGILFFVVLYFAVLRPRV